MLDYSVKPVILKSKISYFLDESHPLRQRVHSTILGELGSSPQLKWFEPSGTENAHN